MRREPAPEFPAGLAWVNADRAPRLGDLRGRVVLLWFWSYDAVNCWNLVPQLRRLEDKYHDGLVVLGLHCPKYPAQRDGAAVLRAVNRLRLRHAVANDADFRVWQACGIDAWPSVLLIDAEGGRAAVFAGEGGFDAIDRAIAQLLDEAARRDLRIYEPALPASRPERRGALAFPGRLLADARRLYVADSGHHRVLECEHDGRVRRVFGSGIAGFGDGDASHAGFDDPQGLAQAGDALYVADRGNHTVRRIDLASGRVETVLGNGRAGRSRPRGRASLQLVPNSPLDLAVLGDELCVAVAGQNQLWRMNLSTRETAVLAGSGELGLVDGIGAEARLAQPSGLAALGRQLFFVDAAASALRVANADDGRVETWIGTGLYDFGDAVGSRLDVRLQNPLALATDSRGAIYVADSYNHAIKRFDRRSGALQALRLDRRLHEPQGLSVCGDRLWIANTNLHEIVCVELDSGRARRVPVDEG